MSKWIAITLLTLGWMSVIGFIMRSLRLQRKQVVRCMTVHIVDCGKKVRVGTIYCGRCKNYYFAPHMDIEVPHYCPYCGLYVEEIEAVSAKEMNRHIV